MKMPILGPIDIIISYTPTELIWPGFDPKPKDEQLWESKQNERRFHPKQASHTQAEFWQRKWQSKSYYVAEIH